MRRRSTTAACAAVALAAIGIAGCGGSGASGSGASGTGRSGSGGGASATAASSPSYGTTRTAVATSSRGALASGSNKASTVFTKQEKGLGTILASGPEQRTIYMFAADKDGKSMCNGSCPDTWPPLTTSGAPRATGGASASALGTITRSDGEKQVTYHGHPLYYYAPDVSASDAFGEGVDSFGARWYVLSPSGTAITKG